MEQSSLSIDNQGRILLPSWWRKKLGASGPTKLFATVNESGGLVIETREQGLRRAQALVRKYVPEGVLLSEQMIEEHRAEAKREQER
jgi:antitoxin PrlF